MMPFGRQCREGRASGQYGVGRDLSLRIRRSRWGDQKEAGNRIRIGSESQINYVIGFNLRIQSSESINHHWIQIDEIQRTFANS